MLLLAGCTLTTTKTAVTPISSPTVYTEPTAQVMPAATQSAPPGLTPTLSSETGPYQDAVGLLEDVCFEHLYSLAGRSWVWTSPADLAAFYTQAEESCGRAISRGPFAFDGQVLVGAVSLATGCDAAHRFVALRTDDAAAMQTLTLHFVIQPGCSYELVQPFLIALPGPPAGYGLAVEVVRAD